MKWKDRLLNAAVAAVVAALSALGISLAPHPTPPLPPEPPPPTHQHPPALPPTPDPINAIVRTQTDSGGCSATIIAPRRPDGRWNLLSAAHCVSRVGQIGSAKLRDGRTIGFTVAAIDRESDASWLVTTEMHANLPFAFLAETTPPPGTPVFHAGFGVDNPGNTESGTVSAVPNSQGRTRYHISVSPGDSGGGICVTKEGFVLSPVCCTTCLGCMGEVWGSSPERCRQLLSRTTIDVFDNWKPVEMPKPLPEK